LRRNADKGWTSPEASIKILAEGAVVEAIPIPECEDKMANVYVEARPKGRPEGTRIDDYVVEDHADSVLYTSNTQREAIDWAKQKGHKPLVARVRHLNDKKNPDHWRAA
jgi:hypothetical protein